MNTQTWKKSGQFYKYKEQYYIFHKVEGAGPPLVLLHGFPTASWDWVKIWPELIKHFEVIALDFIGFGFSDKPKKYTYNLLDQADLVEELLSALGIEQYHLLVHDYGVSVAQELLARALEQGSSKIQSVCFLNGGLFPEMHRPRPIQKALISPMGKLLTPFLSKKMLAKNLTQVFGPDTPPSPEEIDEFYALMENKGGKYIFHKLIRYMKDRRTNKDRWFHSLTQSKMPKLLINGPEDPVSGLHLAQHYQKVVPEAEVVILDKIGHYPQTEAPHLVLQHFLDFHKKG